MIFLSQRFPDCPTSSYLTICGELIQKKLFKLLLLEIQLTVGKLFTPLCALLYQSRVCIWCLVRSLPDFLHITTVRPATFVASLEPGCFKMGWPVLKRAKPFPNLRLF